MTSAPAAFNRRATSAALYAAIPPETPSNTRRPASGSLLGFGLLGSLVVDLPFGDLLERDRERLVREAGLDQRRHELAAAFAELVVVGVDLSARLAARITACTWNPRRRAGRRSWARSRKAFLRIRGAGPLDDSSDLRRCSFQVVVHDRVVEPVPLLAAPIRPSRAGAGSAPPSRCRGPGGAAPAPPSTAAPGRSARRPGTRSRTCEAPLHVDLQDHVPAGRQPVARRTPRGVPERCPTTSAHSSSSPSRDHPVEGSSATKK